MNEDTQQKMMQASDMGEAMMFSHQANNSNTNELNPTQQQSAKESLEDFLKDGLKIIVSPLLANVFGIDEAVILSYLHDAGECYEWVLRTYEEWHKILPFISIEKIETALKNLIDKGVVLVKEIGQSDDTKGYQIDYDRLHEVLKPKSED